MTHPAITAAVTAARDFADVLESAQAALAPSMGVKVGDVAATEADAITLLGRLPDGAEVADRDGDAWAVAEGGNVRFRGDSYTQPAGHAAAYAPLTVTSLPDAGATRVEKVTEPEPAPTRVEIKSKDDVNRIAFAEPGIVGAGSVWLYVKEHGQRSSVWLSRDEARQLAATLTAIADA